jgi:ACS family glucarate transporter-like MFS transporter
MNESKPFDPNSAIDTGSATWVRWRIVALLMALSFLSWFNRVNIATAYTEQIQHQYAISEQQIGLVSTAFLLVYALWMTPGGWFGDRYGTRLSLGLMGIGLGVFAALTGEAGRIFTTGATLLAGFVVIRSIMGLFATPMYPSASRTIARWFPFSHRAHANGFIQGAAQFGTALTPLLFGHLMTQVGWPRAFMIVGAVTGLVGIVWLWYARNSPSQHGAVNAKELALIQADPMPSDEKPDLRPAKWSNLLRNRSLLLLTLSYAAIGYFEYLFNFWQQHYFKDVRHVGEEASRIYTFITNLSMVAGMLLGGTLTMALVRRLGARRGLIIVPIAGMLLGAVFLFIAIRADDPKWTVFWLSLALAAVGATEAPQWTLAVELGGRSGATAAGIFNTGGNLGGALAPYGTPFIKDQFAGSWNAAIAAGSIVLLLGLTLWLWIDPRERVAES